MSKTTVIGCSFFLFLVTSSFAATQTQTVYNPFTGKLDFITTLTSTTIINQFSGCSGTDYLGADGNCYASGGSGSSSLAISAGVSRSSPTSDAIFPSSEFNGSVSGSSMTITLNSSSVTLQGQNIMGGSGSTDQVAYFSASKTLTSSNDFEFFGTSGTIGEAILNFPGNQNGFIGYECGQDLTSGINNTEFGHQAFDQATSAEGNTGFGYLVHDRITTGNENTAFGKGAGDDVITGDANTCIGGGDGTQQPCQNVLYGSSNTMVGGGAGYSGATSSDSANSYFGFDAGTSGNASPVTGAVCIGAYCNVTSSFTADIGELNGPYAVTVNMSTMTVSSATISNDLYLPFISSGKILQAGSNGVISGTTISAGIVSPGTFTWVNTSNGIDVSTIAITGLSTGQIPYTAATSHLLTGSSDIIWDPTSNALDLGGGSSYTSNLNIENSAGSLYYMTVDNNSGGENDNMQFLISGSQVGRYGVLGQGSPDNGPEWDWRLSATNDMMYLDDTGLLTLPGPKGGGLSVTYGISIGSMTGAGLTSCSGSSNAVTWNSSTNLFGCNTISGGGGGGASTLGMGLSNGTVLTTLVSSPTALAVANNVQFLESQLGGATNYMSLNTSSVTLQGPIVSSITTNSFTSLGGLTGNQTITLSGDSSGSGTTAITVTAAATQTNITKIDPSATLILGSPGEPVSIASNTIVQGTTFYYGGMIATGLTASLPVQTNSVGDLTAAAVNLSGSEVTGSLPAASIASGVLGSGVIASSIAVNAVYPGAVSAGTYSNITLPATNLSGAIATANLPPSTTVYIQNTSSLQSGATAYPSFLYVGSSATIPTLVVSGQTGSTQCAEFTTAGLLQGTGSACGSGGGGGSPGGSSGQMQYNSAGSFGGASDFVVGTSSFSVGLNGNYSTFVDSLTVSSFTATGAVLTIGQNMSEDIAVSTGLYVTDGGNNYIVFASTGFVTSASSTTSNTTLTTFANFMFQIPASETWQFDCMIAVTGATGGAKYGVNGPSGATVSAMAFGPLGSATAFTSAGVTALNTATIAFHTNSAATWFEMKGSMTTSTTAGQWAFQREEGTSGTTTTALAGSYCHAWRLL